MDLISKKAAVSRISDLLMLELKGQRFPTWNEVYNAIGDIPSVPAVPIEPLCRYLEVYARTPIYNMRHTAEWWKEELEKEKWEKWTVKQDAAD